MSRKPARHMPFPQRMFLLAVAVVLGGVGAALAVGDLDTAPSSPAPSVRRVAPTDAPVKRTPPPKQRTTCVDVTSYDHNWNNDMLCTRPNGTQFSTSYDGARRFG